MLKLARLNPISHSTALNYNSEAGVDDGTCVEPVLGCTLREMGDYVNSVTNLTVDPETPMYKGRYIGLPTPNLGRYVYADYRTVLNPNASANVLDGCVVAIEGCMVSEVGLGHSCCRACQPCIADHAGAQGRRGPVARAARP